MKQIFQIYSIDTMARNFCLYLFNTCSNHYHNRELDGCYIHIYVCAKYGDDQSISHFTIGMSEISKHMLWLHSMCGYQHAVCGWQIVFMYRTTSQSYISIESPQHKICSLDTITRYMN